MISFFPEFEQIFILIYGGIYFHLGLLFLIIEKKKTVIKTLAQFVTLFGILCLSGAASLYFRLENTGINYIVYLSLITLGPLIPELVGQALGHENTPEQKRDLLWVFLALCVLGGFLSLSSLPIRFLYSLGYLWLVTLIFLEIKKGRRLFGQWSSLPKKIRMFYLIVVQDGLLVLGMLTVQLSGQVQWMLPFWVVLILSLLILTLLLARYPDYFPALKSQAESQRYQNSRWTLEEKHRAMERVRSYMKEQQPFLDPDLRIVDLAEEMGMTGPQLSELVNSVHSVNFNQWINRHRVEYVLGLLEKDGNKTTLELGFSAGFNSKSAFYQAFRSVTGMTPKDYLAGVTPKTV